MLSAVAHIANRIPKVFYTGKVTRVVGLIVEAFLPNVPVGALCHIYLRDRDETLPAEVIGLKGESAILMPIGNLYGIQVGDRIEPIHSEAVVKVGPGLLGRVIDGMGNPMDGLGEIEYTGEMSLYSSCVSAVSRKIISEPMGLGVRAIDGFLTCAVGQRVAIMAGSGVGKSTLLGMIARNADADINVIGLIGERGREVREFIERDLGPEGMKKSVVIVATSDMPALVRMRSAFMTTSIAEYFRNSGLKVLVMMDSLTRFAMASREVGLSLGEPPTVKGYTPSLFSVLPKLLERAGTTSHDGSITGLYTILAEGDDIQDPIADAVRAIVDGHIVLSRKLASVGHYPPIDILQSISRVMTQVVTNDHKEIAQIIRRLLALYTEMEDYIKIGVYQPGKNQELDFAVNKMNEINTILKQEMNEATPLSHTVKMMQQILGA